MKRRNILIGLAAATLLIALGTGLTAAQGKANAGTTAMDTVLPKRRTAGNVAKKQACVIYDLSTPGESTVEVPSFCTDGMCMISVYHDAIMGAFAPGLSWPLYYRQDSTDDSWVGGPNIALGGVSFSDGAGVNGDGSSDAVFIGGTSTDGGYVRVYDDGASESSPDLWTIESMPSELFTEASLYVCAMPSCVQHNVSAEAEWAVEVPDFCIDDMCTVLMWHDATFDAFGPGISWPVHYRQDSTGDSWIGGPNVALGGVSFSGGAGVNGDVNRESIFYGGQTEEGGYLRLTDDGTVESSRTLWTIDFAPDDLLTEGSIYICPMSSCVQHDVSVEVEWPISVPESCVDGMCSVLMWHDATFGAFGPGLSWPVYYRQDPTDDSWIGGPSVALGGVSFSDGAGVNGDVNGESVFLGGQTVQGGYASLYDDGTPESSQLLWTIDFAPDDFLTQASFYICPWSCSGSAMLLYRLYLPLVIKGM